MNKILQKFKPESKKFFMDLQNYMDTELHFYGSVTRDDYVHGKSDIDIAIFTDNEKSTIAKLQHFLHVKRNAFDKLVWKIEGKMVYGYKIKCEPYIDYPIEAKQCEIAVYNNEFKDILMNEMNTQNLIPIQLSILLYILKFFYYKLPLISQSTYVSYKRYIFNTLYKNQHDSVFYLLKQT